MLVFLIGIVDFIIGLVLALLLTSIKLVLIITTSIVWIPILLIQLFKQRKLEEKITIWPWIKENLWYSIYITIDTNN